MKDKRMCILDETKVCDDCGECNRCDLDPNKICDNCCRCIAIEDGGKEFRSVTVNKDSFSGISKPKGQPAPFYRKAEPAKKPTEQIVYSDEEPTELTPELVAQWEKILIEHGEAPADDGFGEIEVNAHDPVYGRRPAGKRRRHKEE